MLTRIKTFLRRMRSFNFKRLWMLVSETAEESGRNKIALLIDMIWCAVTTVPGIWTTASLASLGSAIAPSAKPL